MADFKKFASDDHAGWDQETGEPTIMHFANAVQVWAICQDKPQSVADAAKAFNVEPALVIQAIEDGNAWMFLTGPRDDYGKLIIEHDGE